MKFSVLIAAIASTVLFSGMTYAESDKPQESRMEKPAVKPHSHVQDKTGIPQSASDDKKNAEEKKAANPYNDRSKHFHPRDGK